MNYPRRLPAFKYLMPETVAEACSLLSQYKGKAKIIAGGTDLLPKMQMRVMAPEYLVGLKNITGMNYIQYDEVDGLRFGAMATIHEIETSPVVRERYEVLFHAVSSMASTQIRHMGTVAGNICNAVPSAETAPALIVLGARLKVVSPRGERVIPIEDFFTGPSRTVLEEDELLVEIQIPVMPAHSGGAYLKHTLRRAMDLAMVGVATFMVHEQDSCKEVKIALGAVAPTPIRVVQAEEVLRNKKVTDRLIQKAAEEAAKGALPISDMRSSAEYRTEMIEVLARRALRSAWEKATVRF